MCGRPSMYGVVHARCRRSWGMDGVVGVLEYKGLAKNVIGKIKYRGVRDMYATLVEALVSLGEFSVLANDEWWVVAVPLHKRRLRWRGFNQAELLAERLAGYFGWEYGKGWLVRTKYTKPQVNLVRKERLVNVKGAFDLSGEAGRLKGKNVLLVDDVWTTGATMRECGKVLKRAGAKKVWGLVVAS